MNISISPLLSRQNLLNSIKKGVKNIMWFLAQNAFLVVLIFILLEILLGEFLFYQYISLPRVRDPEITQVSLRFKKEVYKSVLSSWENREKSLTQFSIENLQNPFHSSFITNNE